MAERVPGRLEQLAYERHEKDLALSRQPGGHPRGLWFDEKAGDQVVRWIERYCRHHKGEWSGRKLLLEPWQKWIVRVLFGWKRADGTRRFRIAWIEIPRKNGKTELGGALGVYLLVGDGEPGAEVYTTATKKEQAQICHEAARAMVRQSPQLKKHITVPRALHANLVCEALGSKMQILSSDSKTQDGLSPHGDIRDEVHKWDDHDLVEVLNTAMGARRQPMTVNITTAGVYDPEGVGWQGHEYAVGVLEQDFEDDRQFVFIAAIDEKDDPWDPAVWQKANPNYGVSVKSDNFAEEAEHARRVPSATNGFLRLRLNRWTQVHSKWLDMELWRECDPTVFAPEQLKNVPCYVGLDLSRTTDLTAAVLIFDLPTGELVLRPHFWLPEARVEDEAKKKGQRRYRDWADRGLLNVTPGTEVDYEFIEKTLDQELEFFSIKEVGYDPFNANQLALKLQAKGYVCVSVRQGFLTLSEASKLLEKRVLSKRLRHGGHPILAWCAGNTVTAEDAAGNIKPDKEHSKEKIDGISATVTGLSRIVNAPQDDGGSVYEKRGVLVL